MEQRDLTEWLAGLPLPRLAEVLDAISDEFTARGLEEADEVAELAEVLRVRWRGPVGREPEP